jgi:hypothetical protein
MSRCECTEDGGEKCSGRARLERKASALITLSSHPMLAETWMLNCSRLGALIESELERYDER